MGILLKNALKKKDKTEVLKMLNNELEYTEAYAIDLLEYGTEGYGVERFLADFGITPDLFNKWISAYPTFKNAYKLCLLSDKANLEEQLSMATTRDDQQRIIAIIKFRGFDKSISDFKATSKIQEEEEAGLLDIHATSVESLIG